FHAVTQRGNAASDLVAEDHRLAQPHSAEAAVVEIMQVGTANAAALYANQHFSASRSVGRAILDAQILLSVDDDGSHCVSPSTCVSRIVRQKPTVPAPSHWTGENRCLIRRRRLGYLQRSSRREGPSRNPRPTCACPHGERAFLGGV